jgi:hypothetical protein
LGLITLNYSYSLLLFLGAPKYEYLPIPFNQISCVAVPTLEELLVLVQLKRAPLPFIEIELENIP